VTLLPTSRHAATRLSLGNHALAELEPIARASRALNLIDYCDVDGLAGKQELQAEAFQLLDEGFDILGRHEPDPSDFAIGAKRLVWNKSFVDRAPTRHPTKFND